MAKRKKSTEPKPELAKSKPKEPALSHGAFQLTMWVIILGLVAQLAMALIAYPSLPERIASSWAGRIIPGRTHPAWIVFVFFPGAQVFLLVLALFPRVTNAAGRRVMEIGKAAGLIALALLLTALHSGVFRLQ